MASLAKMRPLVVLGAERPLVVLRVDDVGEDPGNEVGLAQS